jgi:Ca2+/Na+ antiporter
MSTKRKVYTFYIIAILVMVLVLMLCNLNIMAKAIVGLMIVFCIFVMRSIQTAYQLPDDIDPDTMLPIETHGKSTVAMPTEKLDHNSNVDLYLRLLIEADEELAKDSNVDQMSPSYNIQLNNRIAERLESLDKGINK